jgi:hypothetical protein
MDEIGCGRERSVASDWLERTAIRSSAWSESPTILRAELEPSRFDEVLFDGARQAKRVLKATL